MSSSFISIQWKSFAISRGDFAAPERAYSKRLPYRGPLKRVYWDLPALTKKNALDMIHTQCVLPAPVSCRRLVTVHDVLYERFPQYFSPVFRTRSKVLMRYAAVNADHLFTVSEYSRDEISELYRIPAERISVIYNGANYTRLAVPAASDAQVLANRNLTANGYILSVGKVRAARKNHDALIRAYARLGENTPPLVIVGQRDFRFTGIFERIKELHLEGRIRVFEDVTDQELPALYRHAAVFVYPSFAEGFGMPVVEAMAAGVAVVASNNTGIAEIASHGEALLVNPHNIEEIAQAISRLLNDGAFKESLIRAGRERARVFNWETAAQIVRNQYLAVPLRRLTRRKIYGQVILEVSGCVSASNRRSIQMNEIVEDATDHAGSFPADMDQLRDSEDEVSFKGLIIVPLKRKRTIMICALLGLLAAIPRRSLCDDAALSRERP